MTHFVDIHAELASVMDILAKSAVAEIIRLVDDGAAFLRLEISRSHREVAVLRRKLQLIESELQTVRKAALRVHSAQGRSVAVPVCSVIRGADIEEELSPPANKVFGQEWNFRLSRYGEPTEESADMEEIRPESLLIKQEGLEEDLCYRDQQPTPAVDSTEQVAQPTPAGEEQMPQHTPVEEEKKQESEPTSAGDPIELSEKHRCGHSDEELSGLEFVVKVEQEEEHVAQRFNQTEGEHSAERLNNLGSEYVMYETDSQLWTSFTQGDSDIETDDPVCSNATEQYSQSLSGHTERQHASVTVEGSGSTLSSFGSSYVEVFDTMSENLPVYVYGEELRPEAIHTQQGQCREKLGLVTKQDVMSQQQQPQSAESNPDMPIGDMSASVEKRAKAHRRAGMGVKRFSCAQCGKSFTTRFYLKIHRRIHTGERPFNCTQCGKSFYCTSHLTSHQRSHTGEKPYSCDECGNSYSHLNSLKLHYRVHSEER